MKEMFLTLGQAYKKDPVEFFGSIGFVTLLSTALYVSAWICW
jgi:hypothetical protein